MQLLCTKIVSHALSIVWQYIACYTKLQLFYFIPLKLIQSPAPPRGNSRSLIILNNETEYLISHAGHDQRVSPLQGFHVISEVVVYLKQAGGENLSSHHLVFLGQHHSVGRGRVGVMHWLFHSFLGQEGDQGPSHIGSCPHSHRSADGLQRLRCMHLCV